MYNHRLKRLHYLGSCRYKIRDTWMTFYPCWFWENGLSDKLLQVLDDDVQQLELKPGTLAHGHVDTDVRNSNSNAFPSHHWITGILYNYALHANREAGWKRTLEYPEVTQIAEYREGQFYKWHTDNNAYSLQEYDRKITVICLLNDPSEFEGGDFEIEYAMQVPKLKKGSVIAFPSNLRHQVTPVTHGRRLSATCWAVGPQKW